MEQEQVSLKEIVELQRQTLEALKQALELLRAVQQPTTCQPYLHPYLPSPIWPTTGTCGGAQQGNFGTMVYNEAPCCNE
jgi:hypothetical protein